MTKADTYTEVALKVIGTLTNPRGAVVWWENEQDHRRQYELTQEHVDRLKLAMVQKFGKDKLQAAA